MKLQEKQGLGFWIISRNCTAGFVHGFISCGSFTYCNSMEFIL